MKGTCIADFGAGTKCYLFNTPADLENAILLALQLGGNITLIFDRKPWREQHNDY